MNVGNLEDRLAKLEKPERNSELVFYLGCIVLATVGLVVGAIPAPLYIETCKWLAIAYGAGRIIKKTVPGLVI